MANRHANKGLRRAARVRMAATGESYQTARARITAAREAAASPRRVVYTTPSGPFDGDLLEVRIAGQPMVLAVLGLDLLSTTVLHVHLGGGARSYAFPPWFRVTPLGMRRI